MYSTKIKGHGGDRRQELTRPDGAHRGLSPGQRQSSIQAPQRGHQIHGSLRQGRDQPGEEKELPPGEPHADRADVGEDR